MINFAEYLSENKKKHHHEKSRPHFSLDPDREKILQKVYGEKGLSRDDILQSLQMFVNQRKEEDTDDNKSTLSEAIKVSFNSFYLTERDTSFEAKLSKEEAERLKKVNDAKGKVFELAVGDRIAKMAGKDLEDSRPKGKKAADIIQKQREILGEEHFNQIMQHSNDHADSLIDHFEKTGVLQRGNIDNVHWTSLADSNKAKGDHEKLTGQKDLNQYGDIIISHKGENGEMSYVPVSLKYGSNAKPNYKNSGLNSLENFFGMKSGSLTDIKEKTMGKIKGLYGNVFNRDTDTANHSEVFRPMRDKYDAELSNYKKQKDKYVSENLKVLHDQHKSSGGNLNRTAFKQKMLDEYPEFSPSDEVKPYVGATAIDLEGRSEMAKTIHEHSRKRLAEDGHDGHLRDFLRESISPSTIHTTYVSHGHVQSDGNVKNIHFDPTETLNTLMDEYKDLHTHHTGGMGYQIRGVHKDTGETHVIGTPAVKAGSGVFKGTNGTFMANLKNPTKVDSDYVPDYGNNSAKKPDNPQPQQRSLNSGSSHGGFDFYSDRHEELPPEKKTPELTDDSPARPEDVKELVGKARSPLATRIIINAGRRMPGNRSGGISMPKPKVSKTTPKAPLKTKK